MAIHLGRSSPNASRDRPERRRGRPARRPRCRDRLPLLLGLAPGGVFPAAAVAGSAVRSYRTISPLPPMQSQRTAGSAVYFLWHFPWGRPRRALPGTVPPWSPDFPLPANAERGHPTVWHGTMWDCAPSLPNAASPRRLPDEPDKALRRSRILADPISKVQRCDEPGGAVERAVRDPVHA